MAMGWTGVRPGATPSRASARGGSTAPGQRWGTITPPARANPPTTPRQIIQRAIRWLLQGMQHYLEPQGVYPICRGVTKAILSFRGWAREMVFGEGRYP